MIAKLPHWCIIEKFPAFNDFESLTAIEQTARVYGKIQELIESYNKYVDEINTVIEDYELDKYGEVNKFICRITCLTNNYINTVDMKIAHQDRQIAEVYEKFSTDVINTLKLILSDMYSTGELDNVVAQSLANIEQKVNDFIAECETANNDLNTTKTNLANDYENTKQNLQSDYYYFKTELDESYGDFMSRQNKLLIDTVELDDGDVIPDLAKYLLVYVSVTSLTSSESKSCLCYVKRAIDDYLTIEGTGSNVEVNITCAKNGNDYTVHYNGSKVDESLAKVTKIIGII